MIRLSFIAGALIALLVCFGFYSDLSFATDQKVTENSGATYVIQLGAFKDPKSAEQIIRSVSSVGVELFWASNDKGLHVLQSQKFRSRNKAHQLAARLVTDKLINSYFITTAPDKAVSITSYSTEAPEPNSSYFITTTPDKAVPITSHSTDAPQSAPTPVVQDQKKDSSKASLLFTLFETEPDKLKEAALAVLESNPADRAALTALAWHQFRLGNYEDAYSYFAELNRLEPEQTDYVTGMIYALSGMKKLEKVMELTPTVSSFFYNHPGELRK